MSPPDRNETTTEDAYLHAACVMVAAGSSSRFGLTPDGLRKPLVEIEGMSLLEHSTRAFDACQLVREIVLVVHAEDLGRLETLVREKPSFAKVTRVVAGGKERSDSVRAGVAVVSNEARVVAVHDAARPLVRTTLIEEVLRRAFTEDAALAAIAVRDTIKESTHGTHVEHTLDRGRLWAAQTPQAFAMPRFREVLEQAGKEQVGATDDAALWESYVGPVAIVPGDPSNLKVTSPEDLVLARALFSETLRGARLGS